MPHKKNPVATPCKRAADQMAGSPESEAPVTPVPSGVASSPSRSRTVCPYGSPEVENAAEEPEGSIVPEPEALKDERTVLGWKVAARCEVPESAGRLRAGSRPCCVKCAHTYYNFPGQMCWVPSGMAKCADCLRGNHACILATAQLGAELEALQLAADALLNCWADDEDAGLAADSEATPRRRRVPPSRPRIRESLHLPRRKSLGLLRPSRVMLTILARLSFITPRSLWS
ncbi:hypothetical protein GMDG_03272 [Pseudogymnoascus destructans 20631-21]|uniref:Uncharacterized protein n=1 Tax=Pseudogymnoascus destructans (strain ATCC MYA-4855 / 20631-21) TaxID=658429 RepID=L8G653_PSED2|nr:hypothetical protein GMDG_03272 [Pseudogymnoascus destructans 20631-21]